MNTRELYVAVESLEIGGVGIFPAKNGYMLIGSGSQEQYAQSSERIRKLKIKKIYKPLARVATKAYVAHMIGQYSNTTGETTKFVQDYMDEHIIWSVDTEAFPESCHTVHQIGLTTDHNQWESALVHEFGKPIVASSANRTGQPTPMTVDQIDPSLRAEVDFIVDVGPRPHEPDFAVVHLPNLEIYRDSPRIRTILERHNR